MSRRGGLPISSPQRVGGVASPWASPYGSPRSIQGPMPLLPGLGSLHTALDGKALASGTLLNRAGGWNPTVTGTLTRAGTMIECGGSAFAKDPRGAHPDWTWSDGLGMLLVRFRVNAYPMAGNTRIVNIGTGLDTDGEWAFMAESTPRVRLVYRDSAARGVSAIPMTGADALTDKTYHACIYLAAGEGTHGRFHVRVLESSTGWVTVDPRSAMPTGAIGTDTFTLGAPGTGNPKFDGAVACYGCSAAPASQAVADEYLRIFATGTDRIRHSPVATSKGATPLVHYTFDREEPLKNRGSGGSTYDLTDNGATFRRDLDGFGPSGAFTGDYLQYPSAAPIPAVLAMGYDINGMYFRWRDGSGGFDYPIWRATGITSLGPGGWNLSRTAGWFRVSSDAAGSVLAKGTATAGDVEFVCGVDSSMGTYGTVRIFQRVDGGSWVEGTPAALPGVIGASTPATTWHVLRIGETSDEHIIGELALFSTWAEAYALTQ